MITGLLEREDEHRQLAGLVGNACSGRGAVVLLEGPAGIGKTRLLDAAREEARERDMVVLSARASELDRDFPFGVVRQLFEARLINADERERATLLKGAAAPSAPLLTGGAPAGEAADGDPSLALFHALYWLVANLADEAPLALAVDDIHWADTSSLRFLEFLAPRLDELPVLVVLASRPAERQQIDVLATDAATRVLRPSPLSRGGVAALVEGALGSGPDVEFSDACRDATGGNPFLLRELLQELASEDVVPEAAQVQLVRQVAPPTVARAVLLRLARLGEDATSLARALAVLGDDAPLRRVAALADLPEDRADAAAGELARADVLSEARPLAFAHPILRSAVYADIAAGERAHAHRSAAQLLAEEGSPPEALAVHLLASDPAGEPDVVATLREAAARAAARGAAATAAACLRRALDEPPAVEERAALLFELASAEVQAGEPAAGTEHFEEAERITDDPRLIAHHAAEHAVALQVLGRNDEARAAMQRIVERVASVDGALARSLEADLIAGAVLERSRRRWARERLEAYRGELSGATPTERKLMAILAHLDAFAGDAPAEELADAAECALAGNDALEQLGGRGTPFYSAVTVLVLTDRLEPARRALDDAMDAARRRGSNFRFTGASAWRCWLLAREGALHEAEADARSCAEVALSEGWFATAPPMLGFVLEVLIERGELRDAAAILAGSGLADRPAGHDLTFEPVVLARARLRLAGGDLEGARADLAALAKRRSRWNTFSTLAPALLVAPELETRDPAEQRAHAERMLSEAHVWGTPRAIGTALHASALTEGGERCVELLGEAVDVLEGSPARLEHARALADLGAALRRANRRADARAPLREALDLADASGAAPLAERARQELRAAGGRPRRPRISGADALTASERRIARMAAEGLSNPEIAQALFVTKKTVEAHLGNAYRKLGIASRTQLAGALEADPA